MNGQDQFVLLEVRSGRQLPNPSGADVLQTGDLEDIDEYLRLKTGRGLATDGGDHDG